MAGNFDAIQAGHGLYIKNSDVVNSTPEMNVVMVGIVNSFRPFFLAKITSKK